MPLGNKPFENTVGKGEIAHNEQFLVFPQCFLPVWITFFHFRQIWNCRLETLSVWKSIKFVVWEWLKVKTAIKIHLHYKYHTILTLYHTITTFNDPEERAFWKHYGKRRKCWLPAFSPFLIMFSISPKTNVNFSATFIMSSANALNLDRSKNLSSGKELNYGNYCEDGYFALHCLS